MRVPQLREAPGGSRGGRIGLMLLCLLAVIGCFEQSEESQARGVVKAHLESWAYGDSFYGYQEKHPTVDSIDAHRSNHQKLLSYELRDEVRKDGEHAYRFSALLAVKYEDQEQKVPVQFVVKKVAGDGSEFSKEWKLSKQERP